MSKSNLKPSKERMQRVVAAFEGDNNQWRTSREVGLYLPSDTSSQRHQIVYTMSQCEPPVLEREYGPGGILRYRLHPAYKDAVRTLFPSLTDLRSAMMAAGVEAAPEKRIIWTEAVWDNMADIVREIRRRVPGTGVLDAARQAQDSMLKSGMLQAHEKRNLHSQTAIQKLLDRLYDKNGNYITAEAEDAEHVEAVATQKATVEKAEPAPAPEPPAVVIDKTTVESLDLPAASGHAQTIGQIIDQALPGILSAMGASLSEHIAKGVAEGIARGFASLQPIAKPEPDQPKSEMKPAPGLPMMPTGLVEAIDMLNIAATFPRPPKHNPEPEQGPRLPKVLVLGTYPDERPALIKEFSGLLDMRFWAPTDDPDNLKAMLNGSPKRVFALWQRFKQRGHENLVTRTGVPYSRITGGVAQLQEAITSYYVESTS